MGRRRQFLDVLVTPPCRMPHVKLASEGVAASPPFLAAAANQYQGREIIARRPLRRHLQVGRALSQCFLKQATNLGNLCQPRFLWNRCLSIPQVVINQESPHGWDFKPLSPMRAVDARIGLSVLLQLSDISRSSTMSLERFFLFAVACSACTEPDPCLRLRERALCR